MTVVAKKPCTKHLNNMYLQTFMKPLFATRLYYTTFMLRTQSTEKLCNAPAFTGHICIIISILSLKQRVHLIWIQMFSQMKFMSNRHLFLDITSWKEFSYILLKELGIYLLLLSIENPHHLIFRLKVYNVNCRLDILYNNIQTQAIWYKSFTYK